MEDSENTPQVYERERLYEEVLDKPVKIVAQRCGVSDVALAKTCRAKGSVTRAWQVGPTRRTHRLRRFRESESLSP